MTIIGIYGKMHDVDVTGTSIEVTKTMSANPRRIGKLEVVFTMPDREYTDKQKTMIERAAHTCPVHLSLHLTSNRYSRSTGSASPHLPKNH